MSTKLITLRAGFTNIFLVKQDNNLLLVDTGTRNQEKHILQMMSSRGMNQSDLKFIFLTHSHYDHAGSVAQLKSQTGAKIILQESEVDYLKDGFNTIPKGTNGLFKIISRLGKMGKRERKIGWYEPAEADIIFNDSLSLDSFGFNANVIHTPGHTKGSSSMVIDDKVLVGDSMFNLFGNYYPGFANDEQSLHQTWKELFELDVNWYYPSHGKRIRKEKAMVQARKKKII